MKKMKKIPDRWLPYQPMGKQIPGTKFISFKVPLKESICDGMPADNRFTPQMLLESCPGLQLVVDLTNTDRYYDSSTFTDAGVAYKKILTPGHVIPSRRCIQEFFRTVDEFLASTDDDGALIGVHCTHGLNRTSYFVCCYMIHQMGFEPEEAVAAFETARGHKIERLNYVTDLMNRGMGSDDQGSGSWGSRGRDGWRNAPSQQDAPSWRRVAHQQDSRPADKQNWWSRPYDPPPYGNGNQRQRPSQAVDQQHPSSNRSNNRYFPTRDATQQFTRTGQMYMPRSAPYPPYPPNNQRNGARNGHNQQYYNNQQWHAGGNQQHQRFPAPNQRHVPGNGPSQRYPQSTRTTIPSP